MAARKYDVCTAVVGHLPFDARVWKEVKTVTDAGYSVKLVGNHYDLASKYCWSEGNLWVVEIPFGSHSSEKRGLARPISVLRLWWEVFRTRAQLYHAHNVHTFPAMLVAAKLNRARLVYDGHELYGEAESKTIRSRVVAYCSGLVERLAVKTADSVLTTNESRAQVLADRYGRQNVFYLRNVPERVEELVAIDPGFPVGVPILLYQGGIYSEIRAFKETIQALRFVQGLHLVVMGFGSDEDFALLRLWAKESAVSDRVHVVGPRPFEELVHIASLATVGLVPVRVFNANTYLGDTNKLHDYLMAGLPVVASNLPEIRKVLHSGRISVGEVFDPENPESIARAIEDIVSDPAYEERRHEARRIALAMHNWELEGGKLISAFEDLLPRAPREEGVNS